MTASLDGKDHLLNDYLISIQFNGSIDHFYKHSLMYFLKNWLLKSVNGNGYSPE